MRKGKVGIPSEEHAENNDDETHRGSGFDGGFHCSFTNSELEQRHKEQKCSGHEHNEPSFIGHWFSFHMLGWPLTLKAEEHHRKDSSGLVRKTGAKYGPKRQSS